MLTVAADYRSGPEDIHQVGEEVLPPGFCALRR